mmetsp:Transcript_12501/g.24679  ORF Transcript_12501/g.24679 Transcript_12501/m.24679 type:complete len:764 (+) Transcript_12501:69-2360(+)
MAFELSITKQSDSSLAYTNLVYVNPQDFAKLKMGGPDQGADETQVLVEFAWDGCKRGSCVFSTTGDSSVPQGKVALNGSQRDDVFVALEKLVTCRPFRVPVTAAIQTLTVSVDVRQQAAAADAAFLELDAAKLEKLFAKTFKNQVLAVGQKLLSKQKKTLTLTVVSMEFADLDLVGGATSASAASLAHTSWNSRGQFTPGSSCLCLERAGGAKVKLVGGQQEGMKASRNIFNKTFDFGQMGIGGLDNEFNQIFKRAFASRIFPDHIVEQLGIHHVRGMLLFGPPGCGKTLIARQIGQVLNAREPKIVNGPEILDKFVGGSEQKIRDLFKDAEEEQATEGSNSMLHIIIFDEFDAICKSRGSSSDSSGVGDSIVNQLLSKIDGVDSINNVLIIGMTNRKDMIDDAVLRPGRLEVHVEIGLPDEAGRLQILNIHTKAMRDTNSGRQPKRMTDPCEQKLPELAAMSKNYSGAELSGLVRAATSSAMDRCVNKETMVADPSKLVLEWGDFEQALTEVQPKFGAPTTDLEACFSNGMVPYGQEYDRIRRQLDLAKEQVRTSEKTPLLSVLVEGDNMTGKTALVAHAAVASGFPFIRLIEADALIGKGEIAKCHYIQKVFLDSFKSPLSVIILDDLERLIEYTPLGPRFSNMILQTLLILLKKPPPVPGHRLLVLATTAVAHLLEDVQLVSIFNLTVHVPKLDSEAARKVLEELVPMSSSDLAACVSHLGSKTIALKQLLLVAEMSRCPEDTDKLDSDRFFECIHTVLG